MSALEISRLVLMVTFYTVAIVDVWGQVKSERVLNRPRSIRIADAVYVLACVWGGTVFLWALLGHLDSIVVRDWVRWVLWFPIGYPLVRRISGLRRLTNHIEP